MRSKLLKLVSSVVVVAGLLLVCGGLAVTWQKHRQETSTLPDEQKIARTLEIIRTSIPANHKVLKVLFYGQSITRSGWHNAVVAHWREKYPNTVFVVENRALGGFASQYLIRTVERDVTTFYPDLIIFHAYGDHRAYEQILRVFRSQTAADVILQTDHGEIMPDPPCAEGLQLSLHRAPGCGGILWVHQKLWGDEMSYHKIPAFAKKYEMAMEPQRGWWRDYLLANKVDPHSLTRDGLHPNTSGNALMAQLFNRYFDNLVERWNGQTEHNVSSLAAGGKDAGASQTLSFDGNRIELISDHPVTALPTVTIDGQSPRQIDGCYQVTRTSPLNSVPDWPALRLITLLHDQTVQDWTATITHISPDQASFDYTVKASATGDEGSGDSSHPFLSKSGHQKIEPDDWMVKRGYELKPVPLQVPAEVHWSVQFACGNEPEIIDRSNGITEYRYVLGTGLANTRHTVQLSSPAGTSSGSFELREYKPALQVN